MSVLITNPKRKLGLKVSQTTTKTNVWFHFACLKKSYENREELDEVSCLFICTLRCTYQIEQIEKSTLDLVTRNVNNLGSVVELWKHKVIVVSPFTPVFLHSGPTPVNMTIHSNMFMPKKCTTKSLRERQAEMLSRWIRVQMCNMLGQHPLGLWTKLRHRGFSLDVKNNWLWPLDTNHQQKCTLALS